MAKLVFGEGKTWGVAFGVSTRVLFLLATEGRIVRARPLGTWVSGQYRWATTESWLGAPLPESNPAESRAELLTAWLRHMSATKPGTEHLTIEAAVGTPDEDVTTVIDTVSFRPSAAGA